MTLRRIRPTPGGEKPVTAFDAVIRKIGSDIVGLDVNGDVIKRSTNGSQVIRDTISEIPSGSNLFLHPTLKDATFQADLDVSGSTGNPDTFAIAEVTKDLAVLGHYTDFKLATGQSHTALCGFVPNATGIRFSIETVRWRPQALSQTATYTPLVWPEKLTTFVMRRCVGIETKYLTYGDSPTDNSAKRFTQITKNLVDNLGTGNASGFAGIGLHNQLHFAQVGWNIIRGGITGLFIDSSQDVLVSHNTLEGQYGKAVNIYDASNDSLVAENIIAGDPGSGVRVGISVGAGGVNGPTLDLDILNNKIRGRQIGVEIETNGGTNVRLDGNRLRANVQALVDNGVDTIVLPTNTGLNGTTTVSDADHTLKSWERFVMMTPSTAPRTLTLPANPIQDRFITVKRLGSSAHSLTVNGNGKNIEGLATFVLTGMDEAHGFWYDGAQWRLV